jgi:hypothetical protein
MAVNDVKGLSEQSGPLFKEETLGTIEDGIFSPVGTCLFTELTAGETISALDLCCMGSDGEFYKADADVESKSDSMLAIAKDSGSDGSASTFYVWGRVPGFTGLTVGKYYVSATPGGITATRPSGSGQFARIIGYAISSTVLFFCPSSTYIEF